MEQSISQKVVRNTIFNTIGRFWSILVSLFLTPFIINQIGIERYGIWTLIGVLTGYLGLMDLGIGTSFVKHIAEYSSKNDYKKVNQIVNTGFIFYSIFASVIIITGYAFINILLNFLNVNKGMHSEITFVFLLGIILFGISSSLSPFSAIQSGLQQMNITNKITIGRSRPNIAGTVAVLKMGYGLKGLMINSAVILVMLSIANIVVAFKILPALKFNPLFFNRKTFEELFGFGLRMQIARISGTVSNQTDKLLITLLLSVEALTFYQLGSTIINSFVSLSGLLVSALIPAFSEIEARGNREKLVEAYIKGTKYLTFVVAPAFTFLVISAHEIMILWMGAGYERSSLVMQILAVGFMINTIAQVAVSVCIAVNKPQYLATGSIIIIALTIVLDTYFIKTFGFSGAAWGTALAIAIGTIYFVIMMHRDLNIPFKKLLEFITAYFGICIVAAASVWIVNKIIYPYYAQNNRGTALVIIILNGLFFLSVYLSGVYYKGLLDKTDIAFFSQKLPFPQFLQKKLSKMAEHR